MTSSGQFWTTKESNESYIFVKHMTRAFNNTSFTYFGQVFQKLWQYKWYLTPFWHGLLPKMVISRDSG